MRDDLEKEWKESPYGIFYILINNYYVDYIKCLDGIEQELIRIVCGGLIYLQQNKKRLSF